MDSFQELAVQQTQNLFLVQILFLILLQNKAASDWFVCQKKGLGVRGELEIENSGRATIPDPFKFTEFDLDIEAQWKYGSLRR